MSVVVGSQGELKKITQMFLTLTDLERALLDTVSLDEYISAQDLLIKTNPLTGNEDMERLKAALVTLVRYQLVVEDFFHPSGIVHYTLTPYGSKISDLLLLFPRKYRTGSLPQVYTSIVLVKAIVMLFVLEFLYLVGSTLFPTFTVVTVLVELGLLGYFYLDIRYRKVRAMVFFCLQMKYDSLQRKVPFTTLCRILTACNLVWKVRGFEIMRAIGELESHRFIRSEYNSRSQEKDKSRDRLYELSSSYAVGTQK